VAQAEKGAEHEREQNQTWLSEMITRPNKGDNNEIGNDDRRVLSALLRNQRARKPDAQNPHHRI
jgi:hypothetical protein